MVKTGNEGFKKKYEPQINQFSSVLKRETAVH